MRAKLPFHILMILSLLSVDVFAEGKVWSIGISSATSGSFSMTEDGGCNIGGTMTRLSNGFIKFDLTSASGAGNCPSTVPHKFGIEAKDFAIFIQKTLTDERKIIQTIIDGLCPTADWFGNFMFGGFKSDGTHDFTSNNQAGYGKFTYNSDTSQMTVDNIYSVNNHSAISGFSSFNLSGACSDGTITLDGIGDRGGTLNVGEVGGAQFATANSKMIYILPKQSINSVNDFDGSYAGWIFDDSYDQGITPVSMTFSGTSASGNDLSDIENDTAGSDSWAFSNITINAPASGMWTADITLNGGSSYEIACAAYASLNTIHYCISQNPDDSSKPLNWIFVSTAASVEPGVCDWTFGDGEGKKKIKRQKASKPGKRNKARRGALIAGSRRIFLPLSTGTDATGSDEPAVKLVGMMDEQGSLVTTWGSDGLNDGLADLGDLDVDGDVDDMRMGVTGDDGYYTGWGDGGGGIDYFMVGKFGKAKGRKKWRRKHGFSGRHARAKSLVQTEDGNIVVFGWARNASNDKELALAKINRNTGYLVSGWGDGSGKVTTTVGTGDSVCKSGAVDSDGLLYCLGHTRSSDGHDDWLLARYTSGGSLDTPFADNGISQVDFAAGNDRGKSAAVDTYGRLVGGGWATNSDGDRDFALARWNKNGTLDTTMSGDGKLMTEVSGANRHDRGRACGIDRAGRILLAGRTKNASARRKMATIRYNSDGSINTVFGISGKVTCLTTGGEDIEIFGLEQRDNDRIMIFGRSQDSDGDEQTIIYSAGGGD